MVRVNKNSFRWTETYLDEILLTWYLSGTNVDKIKAVWDCSKINVDKTSLVEINLSLI